MKKILTGANLKWIAMILMIINHFFYAYFKFVTHEPEWLNNWQVCLTRTSFVLFAFLISEGIKHTSSFKKYFLRLFVFALISEIPFDLALYGKVFFLGAQNVFFELSFAVLGIYLSKKTDEDIFKILIITGFAILAEILKFDYGLLGIVLIYAFYKNKRDVTGLFFTGVVFVIFTFFSFYIRYLVRYPQLSFIILKTNIIMSSLKEICGLLAFPLIYLYNGEKGERLNKYLYYSVYPIHLILIYVFFLENIQMNHTL